MKTLISIDPGKSTGIAVGTYSDTEPFKLTYVFQIEGGVEGFHSGVRSRKYYGRDYDDYIFWLSVGDKTFTLEEDVQFECEHPEWPECPDDGHRCYGQETVREATVIAEKFNARGQGNGFSYTTDSLEALRVEGAIIAKGLDPIWVQPAQQYFAGGESASSTTNAHRWLKANGLHVTGKDVNCKDANDARSAILHCISYLRRTGHKPTIEKYFPKQEED